MICLSNFLGTLSRQIFLKHTSFITNHYCNTSHLQNDLKPTSEVKAQNEEQFAKNQLKADTLYRVIELELRGNDPAVLHSYSWFALNAAQHLGIPNGQSWTPKKPHHTRYSLLKCVHIYKKHQVQYEFRTYFRYMRFPRLTGSTADTFLEYIQRNLPEGVAMRATRAALFPIPHHIQPPAYLE